METMRCFRFTCLAKLDLSMANHEWEIASALTAAAVVGLQIPWAFGRRGIRVAMVLMSKTSEGGVQG